MQLGRIVAVEPQSSELLRQWEASGMSERFILVVLPGAETIEGLLCQITENEPDAVLVGYGIGMAGISGATVIHELTGLEHSQKYFGPIFTNSYGPEEQFAGVDHLIDGHLRKDPARLAEAFRQFFVGIYEDRQPIKRFEDTNNERMLRELKERTGICIYGVEGNDAGMLNYLATLDSETSIEAMISVETIIQACLKFERLTVLDTALEVFVQIRARAVDEYHDSWCHALSHFVDGLWSSCQVNWLKRLYGVALECWERQGFTNPSWAPGDLMERLATTYYRHAPWDSNPQEFGVTAKTASWLGTPGTIRYDKLAWSRFTREPYSSELEMVLDQLRNDPKRRRMPFCPNQLSPYYFDRMEDWLIRLSAPMENLVELRTLRLNAFLEEQAKPAKEVDTAAIHRMDRQDAYYRQYIDWRVQQLQKQ